MEIGFRTRSLVTTILKASESFNSNNTLNGALQLALAAAQCRASAPRFRASLRGNILAPSASARGGTAPLKRMALGIINFQGGGESQQ